jgi:hypothetical protein
LCRLAAVVRGSPRMIVIVGRTRTREKSVATDLRYGAPLCPKTTVVDGITMISPKRIEDTVRYANITIIEEPMTLASLALASWRHGSRNRCFAMSERSFRSEVTTKTLAKTLASSVVGRAGVIRSFEPEMSGG